ncbi:MAG: hypothetical protein KIS83_05025 [Rubrivivax sp.]|nr:hypothetical protein [Rubrivivax sp.]
MRDSTQRLLELHGLAGRAATPRWSRCWRRCYRPDKRCATGRRGPRRACDRRRVSALGRAQGRPGQRRAHAGRQGQSPAGLLQRCSPPAKRGINLVRGTDRSWAGWRDAALTPLAEAALLRHLAVAHFGRPGHGGLGAGRGTPPAAGGGGSAARPRQADLSALWNGLRQAPEAATHAARRPHAWPPLQPLLRETVRDLLSRLYPDDAPGAAPAVPAAPAGLAAAQSPA